MFQQLVMKIEKGSIGWCSLRFEMCSSFDCSVVVTKIVGRDFTDTNSSIVAVVAALAVWKLWNITL